MTDRYLHTELIFDAETIAKSANSTTDAIDLNKYRPEGYFSLQLTVTGTGTAKLSTCCRITVSIIWNQLQERTL